METYQSRLEELRAIYQLGDYKTTCGECGELIERLVGIIYPDFHNHLEEPNERKTFLELEEKWGNEWHKFLNGPTTGIS